MLLSIMANLIFTPTSPPEPPGPGGGGQTGGGGGSEYVYDKWNRGGDIINIDVIENNQKIIKVVTSFLITNN